MNGFRLKVGRDVPFDVGSALILLHIRHLTIGPNVFLDIFVAVIIIWEAFHEVFFWSKRTKQAKLLKKLYSALQAKGSMSFARIEM